MIVGTIPIAVLGVLFKHSIETVARNLWLIATTMVVFGVLLGLAERVRAASASSCGSSSRPTA